MGQEGVIPKQWGIFIEQNLLEKIPYKVSSGIIAGYTEYQSNKDGEYTFFIGAQVSSDENVPEGMVVKVIPEGNYAVLTSEIGLNSLIIDFVVKPIGAIQFTPNIWSRCSPDFFPECLNNFPNRSSGGCLFGHSLRKLEFIQKRSE